MSNASSTEAFHLSCLSQISLNFPKLGKTRWPPPLWRKTILNKIRSWPTASMQISVYAHWLPRVDYRNTDKWADSQLSQVPNSCNIKYQLQLLHSFHKIIVASYKIRSNVVATLKDLGHLWLCYIRKWAKHGILAIKVLGVLWDCESRNLSFQALLLSGPRSMPNADQQLTHPRSWPMQVCRKLEKAS